MEFKKVNLEEVPKQQGKYSDLIELIRTKSKDEAICVKIEGNPVQFRMNIRNGLASHGVKVKTAVKNNELFLI
jgi:hypothetical protein